MILLIGDNKFCNEQNDKTILIRALLKSPQGFRTSLTLGARRLTLAIPEGFTLGSHDWAERSLRCIKNLFQTDGVSQPAEFQTGTSRTSRSFGRDSLVDHWILVDRWRTSRFLIDGNDAPKNWCFYEESSFDESSLWDGLGEKYGKVGHPFVSTPRWVKFS